VRSSLDLVIATLSLCAACNGCTSSHAQSVALNASPTLELAQPPYPPPATFLSKETGKVLIIELGGDGHEPADAKRLFIELQTPTDARKFVPLIESRALLRGVTIFDPGSQMLYSFDAVVTGKRLDGPPDIANVWITLKVSKLRISPMQYPST
jgi:hypothetical protein